MLSQVLATILVQIEDVLLTFLLGLFVTFLGILIIVILVKFAGYLFTKNNGVETIEKASEKPTQTVSDNDVPEHVKVAIIAAITAYYYQNENKTKADFIVKRIKRI